MKFWLRLGYGASLFFVVFAVITFVMNMTETSAKPQIVEAVSEVVPTMTTSNTGDPVVEAISEEMSTTTISNILVPSPFQPETPVPTVTIEPTATKEPLVSGYELVDLVDLSSLAPVALTIHLVDGKLMSTNWAGTVAYKDTDDQKSIFAPSKGVIYSYLGDVLTTWAHSGIAEVDNQYFFATNWDLYIRKSPENRTLSLAEAVEKAASLKGITAYLCQDEPNTVAFLSDHDANSKCPGKEIELELVAFAIVPHEKLPEYNKSILDLNSWLGK